MRHSQSEELADGRCTSVGRGDCPGVGSLAIDRRVLVTYLLPGLFSSYRAWVQVHSLDLIVARRELRSGDIIKVRTVSWARTYVYVDLVLIQGAHAETLAVHEIPKNHNPSIDPRWRRDSIDLVLTDPLLSGFDWGAANTRECRGRAAVAANASAVGSRGGGAVGAEAIAHSRAVSSRVSNQDQLNRGYQ